jgi:hypothetical protein
MLLNSVELERIVKGQFFPKKIRVVCDTPDSRFELIDILRRDSLSKSFYRVRLDAINVMQRTLG